MCVIVHQPQGTHLEKDRAERLWNKNPDGGGFAFIDDEGEISGFKSMEFKPFWTAFESSRSQFPNRDFLVHMRIATSGAVDLTNVHPFRVTDDTVMAHNGIIHGVGADPKIGESDTKIFVQEVLPRLHDQWLDDPYLVDMVEEWIGWSKLMFLSNDPGLEKNVYILNEKSGTKVDGMWFSNTSGVYKSYSTTTRYRTLTTPSEDHKREAYWWESDDPYGRPSWEEDRKKTQVAPSSVDLDDFVVPLGEEKEMKELLIDIRAESGYDMRIQYDKAMEVFTCWGCDEEVNAQTGDCECWDKVCLDCNSIAGMCMCPGGYSSNLTYWEQAKQETRDAAVRMKGL